VILSRSSADDRGRGRSGPRAMRWRGLCSIAALSTGSGHEPAGGHLAAGHELARGRRSTGSLNPHEEADGLSNASFPSSHGIGGTELTRRSAFRAAPSGCLWCWLPHEAGRPNMPLRGRSATTPGPALSRRGLTTDRAGLRLCSCRKWQPGPR
jgi:hypothetical protein